MAIPATLLEFCDRFLDEEACETYLKQVRWPRGFVCPGCAKHGASFVRSRSLCQCRECRHQVSLTAETISHASRVPLRKWFLAMFFLARHKQGISALQLQRDLGLGSWPHSLSYARAQLAPSRGFNPPSSGSSRR